MLNDLTDEELIRSIDEDEGSCYKTLLNRYLNKYHIIVHKVAQKLNVYKIDHEDFLLAFFICFKNALETYDEKKTLFKTYLSRIFERQVTKEIIGRFESKDALDHSLSLDEEVDGLKKIDLVSNKHDDIKPKLYVKSAKELMLSNIDEKDKTMSNQSKAIVLKSGGYSYPEIASILNISVSTARRLIEDDVDGKLSEIKIFLS